MAANNWSVQTSNFTWIDISEPTEDELQQIGEKYGLHQYTLRDCLQPDHLPKHEDLGKYQFVITRMLNGENVQKAFTIQQISSKVAIFYSADLIITIHRLPQEFLKTIKEKYLDTQRCKNSSEIITKIIWFVLHSYDKPAIDLSREVDAFEEKMFLKTPTSDMMEQLYFIKRKASICNNLLMLTHEVINTIPVAGNDKVALKDVKDLHTKLTTLYNQGQDDVTNLLSVYLSLTAQKTNDVMKILAIFSVFFMPLTFIAGIYGMNFEAMPELKLKWAYPAVLILMVLVALTIFWWLRRKKWI